MKNFKEIIFYKFSKRQKQALLLFAILLIFLAFYFSFYINEGTTFYVNTDDTTTLLKLQQQIEKAKNTSPFSGNSCKNYKRRALGIIVAQYPETMPLSGISQAAVAIEGPTANPGGVTRILLIFQCNLPKEVGSIRSVRPYMVDNALGHDVVLSSWGGASSAIAKIKQLKVDWFDGRANPGGAFFRKNNRYAPHNGFARPSDLWDNVKAQKIRRTNQFKGYKFLEKNKIKPKKATKVIKIDYYYPVKFVYDQKTGKYFRYWNEQKAIDLNTGKQAYADNLILMKTKQGVLSPGVANVKVTGSGTAMIYQLGKTIKGRWVKKTSESRLLFLDSKGKEIRMVPGHTWIELVEGF